MKFFSKQIVKVSAFYLEKQKGFIPKKIYNLNRSLYIGQESSNRWRFAVPIFREGFGLFLELFWLMQFSKSQFLSCGRVSGEIQVS